MSTKAITCHTLHCDAEASDDCRGTFIDSDSEGTIHGSTPEEVRKWATGRNYDGDWVTLPDGRDVCSDCRSALAAKPHPFFPEAGTDLYPFCALCGEPPNDDEELHDNVEVPGQMEIPTGGAT
jgi:hypothetical protein